MDREKLAENRILDNRVYSNRYHNQSLDSLTIILLYCSFLKTVISIYFHYCIHAHLVMFIKRICYAGHSVLYIYLVVLISFIRILNFSNFIQ